MSQRSGAGAPSHASRAHCSDERKSPEATSTSYAHAKSDERCGRSSPIATGRTPSRTTGDSAHTLDAPVPRCTQSEPARCACPVALDNDEALRHLAAQTRRLTEIPPRIGLFLRGP